MSTKAERTTAYIIETVAPIFNRQGYIGTSMSDLTEATGLTKGALYGNFENKDALALAAFNYNSSKLLNALDEVLSVTGNAMDKLYSLTSFYRDYDIFTREMEGKIALVLEEGVNAGEIRMPVSPLQFAKQFYTMIQGAIAMATIMQDRKYLINTLTYLDLLVGKEIKK